jgi:AraC family ethanolamine operon transcriptional activator
LDVRSERLESIENLKNPIGNSQIEIVQLGRGRFSGDILHGQIGNIAFSRGHFSLPVRATGVFSQDKLVIGTLLNCSGASRSLTEPVVAGDVLVHPPSSEHDRLYEGAAHFAGLMCDPAELLNLFAAEQEASDPEFWARRRHFHFAGTRRASLEALLALLAGRLHHGKIRTGSAAEYWKRALLDAFVGPVALEPKAGRERAVPNSIRIVRDVERYLEAQGDRAVHVSEICEKIKVRRRTLYRAFDEAVGIGPSDFLRAKRLSMVHLRLRQADPDETGVVEIATELGFLELGRFAQQYRARFGEYPRDTLRRNARPKRPDQKTSSASDDLARFA